MVPESVHGRKVGRRMSSIRKKPSGRYEARYRDPGGRLRGKTFRTKRAAQEFLDRTGTAIGDGTWRDPALAKVPLVDYTTWWLDQRPRTRELYSGLLRLHIEPHLGECAFGSLTTAEIRSWHARLLQRGTPGPVTVAKAYRLLRCILNDAVEDGLLLRNPCTIRGAGVERSPERPVATIEQVYQLADAIDARYRLMVLLGTFCGLRLGELVALRRDRVDLLHRRVIVSEQGQELSDGTRYYGPPKTAAGVRSVALPPHLVVDVEHHLLRWVGPEPTDLLFTGPKANELYRATFNAAWDRARRSVGMDTFHFHDLRHTGNTLAAGTGASTRELMARMGHASARAALIYQHASEERDIQIAERLSAMTDEALGRSKNPVNADESSHIGRNG
jgi:integrase